MELRDFRALRISLASPDQIRSWSYGEVTKPETINYRRLRAEKDGLFDEAIFGPTRDFQCYCGKYKNIRYKGIICDKCGVEVTKASVRRERMAHINLAAPVAHVWYTRRVPSFLGTLLDITRRNLDRVLYFAQYVVTHVDEEARQKALRRLQEDFERRSADLEGKTKAQEESASGKTLKELVKKQVVLDQILDKFKTQLDEETDPVMKAAQKLQKELETKQNKTIRVGIVFEPTGEVIAKEGEIVTPAQQVLLKKLVKDKLNQIETGINEEKERQVSKVQGEIELLQSKVDDETRAVAARLAQEMETLTSKHSQDLEDVKSLATLQFLTETRMREMKLKFSQVFKADMGAEAFYEILRRIDLEQMSKELWKEVRTSLSKVKKKKAIKRLRIVEALRKSNNRPEWMILTVLPVIPPELRPMVQLDGGRFATSDLNDLYRRVINRNNRLKRLLELGAPDVIVRNEKRMLQEAVDSLIDNSQRGKALSRRGRRELKSLSDMLKGKKGRFRRNLLGKRVDYSGRSVIVVGPKLKLHQCGLPKTMALELFKPFVIQKLCELNYATNVKSAKRVIERERPEVWEVLEDVIKTRPVLLNRAPTLHRLGIQAFEPILVEGKAIQLHPLVCQAFNADFDGDQMAVHVPLSGKAVEEARRLMIASGNLLKPSDGEPIVSPQKDMVLGVYYMLFDPVALKAGRKGDGRVFGSIDEVEMEYQTDRVHIHARIKLLVDTYHDDAGVRYKDNVSRNRIVETTVGKALFNRIVPPEMRFYNGGPLDKSKLQKFVSQTFQVLGPEGQADAVAFVDRIKDIGYTYATRSGISIAIADITVPADKADILAAADTLVQDVERQYRRGMLTEVERDQRTIEIWTKSKDDLQESVKGSLDKAGNLAMQVFSGATKGGIGTIAQLAGMRGMMADPSGRIIPLPIRSNFREGLDALEFFISTHGQRKGLADTAMRTADAGYLTRRLCDVAQDVIVNEADCGTSRGLWVRATDDFGGQKMRERLLGRNTQADVLDPATGELIVARGEMIDEARLELIEKAKVTEAFVRTPLECELKYGCCQTCYGRDLARGKPIAIGAAVGIMAAQSIGEPGTQLTLRTFHSGGVASASDITQGLPRVEELLEARKKPKAEALMADIDGKIHIERLDGGMRRVEIVDTQLQKDVYEVPGKWQILVADESEIKDKEVIARLGDQELRAEHGGRVRRDGLTITVGYDKREVVEYELPPAARMTVQEGATVKAGDPMTEGTKNPHMLLKVLGRESAQMYLLSEVQKVYRQQGVNINDKHFEIIIRKMLLRAQITNPGDSDYLPGDLAHRLELRNTNERLVSEGKRPAVGSPVLLGVSKASLATDSFLSASSFQQTIKVLAGAAIEGKRDDLLGLKENVILGKLIPAGTSFRAPGITEYEGVMIGMPEPRPKATLTQQAEAALLGITQDETLPGEALPSFDDLKLPEEPAAE
ncbi:MAG TPA: DNA-directed RNA polymerase subunit beta' [Thermoflexales bacterium]|nr:DNA-directed RNA polymerase subunit beta' [Thermoflexales bacterium]HQZ52542.1 DNA-directed RNA polymerase subunit beta' [Thermoflexales bacterium]HRA54538.1 DNA-directed RNA polymerase subunit beta' [Thermoflexales bacterium]